MWRRAFAATCCHPAVAPSMTILAPLAAPCPSLSTPRLFERQARISPASIAARSCGAALTYTQLNERANRAARHLRALGSKPDAIVGIFMERGLDMLTALLAVHKAGAAYL